MIANDEPSFAIGSLVVTRGPLGHAWCASGYRLVRYGTATGWRWASALEAAVFERMVIR